MEIIRPELDFSYVKGKTILAVGAHADDVTIFAGGTLSALVTAGAVVHLIRATDDYTDSFGISAEETRKINLDQLKQSMKILGVSKIHNFDYPTDQLSNIKLTELREKLIFKFRELKPYAVISFDPYSAYGEDNQDHVMVAKAVDESYWTSIFDKHHPEHFALGVAPHAVTERWYFGRELTRTTSIVDISDHIDRKILAVNSHQIMMENMLYQLTVLERDSGRKLLIKDRELLVDLITRNRAKSIAESAESFDLDHLEYAESFRIVRFNGMEKAFASDPD